MPKTSQELAQTIEDARTKAAAVQHAADVVEALLNERRGHEAAWARAQGVAEAVPESISAKERAASLAQAVAEMDAAIERASADLEGLR